MQNKVFRFLDLLSDAAKKEEPIDLSRGFRCLTADMIVDYAYQQNFGGLSSKCFKHPIIEAADDLAKVTQWATYFRRTFSILETISQCLPEIVLRYLFPESITVNEFEKASVAQT